MNAISSIRTRADVHRCSRSPLKKLNSDKVAASQKHNHLLAALSAEILERLSPQPGIGLDAAR